MELIKRTINCLLFDNVFPQSWIVSQLFWVLAAKIVGIKKQNALGFEIKISNILLD